MNNIDTNFFDLIIVGTGLIESIVSCVAAKRGKKVLHLDENDYYGSGFASFTLSAVIQLFQPGFSISRQCFVVKNDFHKYGALISTFSSINRWSDNGSKIHPSFINSNFVQGHQRGYDNSLIHPAWLNINDKVCRIMNFLKNDRDFNIDTNSKLIFGSGKIISNLIESGVANYLEFNSCEGVFLFPTASSGWDPLGWKIPLNKNDIFTSTRLSAFDKRCLVKFQQFVADYDTHKTGTDVKRLNEVELARGRSLHRPQNKSESSLVMPSNNFVELLDSFKLSPLLQALTLHVICLNMKSNEDPINSETSLQSVATFLHSLSRYSNSAFLCPIYGISEILQGYCRMSAVWGTTFALRRGVASFSHHLELDDQLVVTDTEGNMFHSKSLLINNQYLPIKDVRFQPCLMLNSIIIYDRQIFGESRSVGVIPPKHSFYDSLEFVELHNNHAIYLVEKDSSTGCCPLGSFVLHVTTLFDAGNGETILEGTDFERMSMVCSPDVNILIGKVIRLIRLQHGGEPFDCHQITFLQPLFKSCNQMPSHVHVTGLDATCSMSMNLDSELMAAEKIWQDLFDEPFAIPPSPTNIEERSADDFDDGKEITDILSLITGNDLK